MFIHNRLTQHVSGIIMPIVRRTDCIKPRLVLAWMCWLQLCGVRTRAALTPDVVLYSLFSWRWAWWCPKHVELTYC